MKCTRLPGNYFDIKTNNKPQYRLPHHLPRHLDEFIRQNLGNTPYIELGYTDTGVILITSKNKLEWNKTIHDSFCETFNVILHSVEKVETFKPRNYEMNIYYLYIPKFYVDNYNELYSVDINDVVL